MFCIRCGKELPDDALFCPYCGQKANAAIAFEEEDAEPLRSIVFRRPPSPVGAQVTLELYFDDELIFTLFPGNTYKLEGVDSGKHSFFAIPPARAKKEKEKFRKKGAVVPEGTKSLTYEVICGLRDVKYSKVD